MPCKARTEHAFVIIVRRFPGRQCRSAEIDRQVAFKGALMRFFVYQRAVAAFDDHIIT